MLIFDDDSGGVIVDGGSRKMDIGLSSIEIEIVLKRMFVREREREWVSEREKGKAIFFIDFDWVRFKFRFLFDYNLIDKVIAMVSDCACARRFHAGVVVEDLID